MAACHSTQTVFGYYMPGLNRRPIYERAMGINVLEQLHKAHSAHPRRQEVGKEHCIARPPQFKQRINSDPLLYTHLAIQEQVSLARGQPATTIVKGAGRGNVQKRHGPCYRGCVTTVLRPNGHPSWHGVPRKWNELLAAGAVSASSIWIGVPANAQLCTPCYLMISREARKLVKLLPNGVKQGEAAQPAEGPLTEHQCGEAPAVEVLHPPSKDGGTRKNSGVTASVLNLLSEDRGAKPGAKRRKVSAVPFGIRPAQCGGASSSADAPAVPRGESELP